jgi:hypothetical protein
VHQAYVARVKRSESLVVLGSTDKEDGTGSNFFVVLLDPATGKPLNEETAGPFPVRLPTGAQVNNPSGTPAS